MLLVLLAVMFTGLFMNAAISSAFSSGPWLFAVPYLVSQLGPAAVTAVVVGPAGVDLSKRPGSLCFLRSL